jgi:hypothetical protein
MLVARRPYSDYFSSAAAAFWHSTGIQLAQGYLSSSVSLPKRQKYAGSLSIIHSY